MYYSRNKVNYLWMFENTNAIVYYQSNSLQVQVMRYSIFLFLIVLSLNSSARIYSQYDIDDLNQGSGKELLSKTFVVGFFTAKDSEKYIEGYLQNSKNKQNPIVLEYQLYQLLNEISYQTKQDFLQRFVDQMKVYKAQTFKIHDEGRVPVAIYNLHTRAKGIENIWSASDALVYYQRSFAKGSIATLLSLKDSLPSLKQPEWFGLKKSIQTISQEDTDLITGYLLDDRENLIGLDKFVSRYTLLVQDEVLTEFALRILDKSNSEYLLRNLKNNFGQSFVKRQLLNMIEYKRNENFAISLMAEYLNDHEIEKTLVSLLENDKYSKQAAMALAQTVNNQVIGDVETLFFKSSSEMVKRQIIFMLKMNQMDSSQVVLERILRNSEKGLKASKWLQSFQGERK